MTDKQNEVGLLPCAVIEEWRSIDGYEGSGHSLDRKENFRE